MLWPCWSWHPCGNCRCKWPRRRKNSRVSTRAAVAQQPVGSTEVWKSGVDEPMKIYENDDLDHKNGDVPLKMVKLVIETIQKCCSWCDLVVFENNLFFTMTYRGFDRPYGDWWGYTWDMGGWIIVLQLGIPFLTNQWPVERRDGSLTQKNAGFLGIELGISCFFWGGAI